jgi:hypothetical protein
LHDWLDIDICDFDALVVVDFQRFIDDLWRSLDGQAFMRALTVG